MLGLVVVDGSTGEGMSLLGMCCYLVCYLMFLFDDILWFVGLTGCSLSYRCFVFV